MFLPYKVFQVCGRNCSAKGAAAFRYPPGGACTEDRFGANIEAIWYWPFSYWDLARLLFAELALQVV
jgi:hypothetical protein